MSTCQKCNSEMYETEYFASNGSNRTLVKCSNISCGHGFWKGNPPLDDYEESSKEESRISILEKQEISTDAAIFIADLERRLRAVEHKLTDISSIPGQLGNMG